MRVELLAKGFLLPSFEAFRVGFKPTLSDSINGCLREGLVLELLGPSHEAGGLGRGMIDVAFDGFLKSGWVI